MDFVRSHFGKMNLWPVKHFFEHICHHFWVGLLLHPPKKVFNWSEVHLSEMTCYKIHTLEQFFLTVGQNNFDNKIQFFWLHCELLASSTQLEKIIAKSVKFSWANTSIQCVRSTEYFFQRHTVVNISHRIKNRPYFNAR